VYSVGLDRLHTGAVGSNPTQVMDVCPRLSVLCCLATGRSPVQGVLPGAEKQLQSTPIGGALGSLRTVETQVNKGKVKMLRDEQCGFCN
jgi:hypothetical protein